MTAAEDSYLNDIPPQWADEEEAAPEQPEIPFLVTEDIDKPDDFLKAAPRSRNAVAYEKKIKRIEVSIMRYAIQSPKTVADAAALITYGQQVAKTGGDLAAKDSRVAGAIDFLSEGAGNPYLEFGIAFGILALQIIRNHEPKVETEPKRKIRIPFTQRFIKLRLRIKLGRLRKVTQEPGLLTEHVLGDPQTQKLLEKYHGIRINNE